jgi:hypothetical protein
MYSSVRVRLWESPTSFLLCPAKSLQGRFRSPQFSAALILERAEATQPEPNVIHRIRQADQVRPC